MRELPKNCTAKRTPEAKLKSFTAATHPNKHGIAPGIAPKKLLMKTFFLKECKYKCKTRKIIGLDRNI